MAHENAHVTYVIEESDEALVIRHFEETVRKYKNSYSYLLGEAGGTRALTGMC